MDSDDSAEVRPIEQERAYFEQQLEASTPEFWRRLGGVDCREQRVLDFGCGHGALCIDIARRGAKSVLGVDLDRGRIDFARQNLAENYPEFLGIVRFECVDVGEVEGAFDLVVSKDTMEHVDDLPLVAGHLDRLTVPGGLLAFGFSPLYFSPFGDHGRFLGRGIPWLPVMLPRPLLFVLASRASGRSIRSLSDVGLNGYTPSRFRRALARDGWSTEQLIYNAGDRRGLRLLSGLRRVPFLEPLFTVSIYTRIRKHR
jgi:SAM-dependent methyltransferase